MTINTGEEMDILEEVLVGGKDERHCQQTPDEAKFLAETASLITDGVIVEIGRRFGGSTLLLCSYSKNSKMYSIDTETVDSERAFKLLTDHGILPESFTFITNHSQHISKWNVPIDLLFIDGNHTTNACRIDLEIWVPRVKPGGLVLVHDVGSTGIPGPKLAIAEYLKAGGPLTFVKQIGSSQLLRKME